MQHLFRRQYGYCYSSQPSCKLASQKGDCSHPNHIHMHGNYEKHAPRAFQDIAAVAKVSCKHGLWIVARVNKKTETAHFGVSAYIFPVIIYCSFNCSPAITLTSATSCTTTALVRLVASRIRSSTVTVATQK